MLIEARCPECGCLSDGRLCSMCSIDVQALLLKEDRALAGQPVETEED